MIRWLKSLFGKKEEAKMEIIVKQPPELHLWRRSYSDTSTIGELYLDSEFNCFTLEDTVRLSKQAKVTAIPAGRYEVVMAWSRRYNKLMPNLVAVPQYTGILIHPGNIATQTDGCLLVGRTRTPDFVGESVLAFEELLPRIVELTSKQHLYISINGGYRYEDWALRNRAV